MLQHQPYLHPRLSGRATRTVQVATMKVRIVVLITALAVTAAGCSSTSETSGGESGGTQPSTHTLTVDGLAFLCQGQGPQSVRAPLTIGDQVQVLDGDGSVLGAGTVQDTGDGCHLSATVTGLPEVPVYQVWKDCAVCTKTVYTLDELESNGWQAEI